MKLIIKTTNTLTEGQVLTVEKDGVRLDVVDGDTLIGEISDSASATVPDATPAHMVTTYMKKDKGTITVKEELSPAVGGILFYLAEMDDKESPAPVVEFTLKGQLNVYSGKKDAIEALDALGKIPVQLKMIDEKIIGFYLNKEIGHVSSRDESYETLRDHLEDLNVLDGEANKKDRGSIIGSINFGDKPVVTKKVSITKEFDRIVAEGIDTMDNLEEKLKYLTENKVPKIAIANLFASYKAYPQDVAKRIMQKPSTLYVDKADIVERVIPAANEGMHLSFQGEKGVGKNVLTETMSWLYNRPLYEYSFNSGQTNNSLQGGKTFADEVEDSKEEKKETVTSALGFFKLMWKTLVKGQAEYQETELERAQKILYKALGKNDKSLVFEMSSILEAAINGGLLVMDEFNTAHPSILSVFNSLLDDRGRTEVTGLGQITKDSHFFAISTQNNDYEGTFQQNEATTNRFANILFPAPTSIIEILQAAVPGVSFNVATQCNNIYMGIRNAAMNPDGELDKQAISIRGFVRACRVHLAQGVSLEKALQTHVADGVLDEYGREAVSTMINMELSV